MKAGLISYTKVREIARVGTPDNEEVLLKFALAGSAARLRQLVRGWQRFDREGELGAENRRHRLRRFSVTIDGDGMYVVHGRLEPEVGAVLMRAVEAAADAVYGEENPAARPTPAQRRADAAGLLAERALSAGFKGAASGARAERYQVVVHTEPATLAATGEPGRSELDGVRICAETARRMACDAAVVQMVHGEGGEILNVGRKTRTVPPHIRRALEERDRGCRYPGCASRFTEAHHVKHWADFLPPHPNHPARSGTGRRASRTGRFRGLWRPPPGTRSTRDGVEADPGRVPLSPPPPHIAPCPTHAIAPGWRSARLPSNATWNVSARRRVAR